MCEGGVYEPVLLHEMGLKSQHHQQRKPQQAQKFQGFGYFEILKVICEKKKMKTIKQFTKQ